MFNEIDLGGRVGGRRNKAEVHRTKQYQQQH